MKSVSRQYSITGTRSRELVASIEAGVEAGHLAPGSPLPAVRRLAGDLGISPATVAAAYRTLQRRGVVVARERGRTRVSHRPPLSTSLTVPVPPGAKDLATGNPDPTLLPALPDMAEMVTSPPRLYGEPAQSPELAELAKAHFAQDGIDPSSLAIVSGALDGIERILNVHMRVGDRIAVEDPCYVGVLNLCRAMGLIPHAVELDDSGMKPGALSEALDAGAEAVIVTPRSQNPLGSAFDEPRAQELRDVLERHPSVLLVEDDHAGMITGMPAVTLSQGRQHWACVRSVTKALGPDLRLGVVAGDHATISRLEGRQRLGCGWVSHLLQHVVAELWADTSVVELLAEATQTYATRQATLKTSLRNARIAARGRSGLHLWIPVREEAPVVGGLLQRGWAVRAGESFRIVSGPAIRITTAVLREDEADSFVRDLGSILNVHDYTNLP